MKPALKICGGCGVPKVIWKNVSNEGEQLKLCRLCFLRHKPQFTIKQVSDKRKLQNEQYKIIREEYLKKHPRCEAAIPGVCSGKPANQVHHSRGRNKHYLDQTTFLAVDDNCHKWIELHPKESYELGFSELRLSNQ